MKKTTPLKVLNVLLAILFVLQTLTIVALKLNLLGDSIGEVHEIGGYALVTVVLIHLWFNRIWIKNSYFQKRAERANSPRKTTDPVPLNKVKD